MAEWKQKRLSRKPFTFNGHIRRDWDNHVNAGMAIMPDGHVSMGVPLDEGNEPVKAIVVDEVQELLDDMVKEFGRKKRKVDRFTPHNWWRLCRPIDRFGTYVFVALTIAIVLMAATELWG